MSIKSSVYEGILSAIGEGVILIDPQNIIFYLNKHAENILDTKANKILNMNFFEVIPFGNREEISNGINSFHVASKSKPFAMKLPFLGKVVWVRFNPIYEKKAKYSGTIITLHNYMMRSELTTMKKDFIANVSYEVRTLLNSILIATEIMSDETFKADTEERKKFLSIVSEDVNKLSSLMNNFMDIIQIQTSKLEMKKEFIDIPQLIETSVNNMKSMADGRSVKIKTFLPKKLPQVTGDFEWLCQVMYKILSNSIKSTPPLGEINIKVKDYSDRVEIKMIDPGKPISPKDLKKIFTPLIEIGKTHAKDSFSIRLELSIAKNIIELHHGKIWAKSIKNQGNVFAFTLPIAYH